VSRADHATSELVDLLAGAADPRTKEHWQRYLRGTASFRGVPMAAIRRTVRTLWRQERLSTWETEDLLGLAHRWFTTL